MKTDAWTVSTAMKIVPQQWDVGPKYRCSNCVSLPYPSGQTGARHSLRASSRGVMLGGMLSDPQLKLVNQQFFIAMLRMSCLVLAFSLARCCSE